MCLKPTQHELLRVLHNLWCNNLLEAQDLKTILEKKGYDLRVLLYNEITIKSFDGNETISVKDKSENDA